MHVSTSEGVDVRDKVQLQAAEQPRSNARRTRPHRVKVSAKLDQIAKYSRPWRRGGHRTTREREWTKLTLNLREICLLHRPTSLFDGSARPQTDATSEHPKTWPMDTHND